MKQYRLADLTVKVICGDLTKQDSEAIVNAANSRLAGGGGVDGAIHRAGGPSIMVECDAIRKAQGSCPTGQAVITGGGHLPAKFVIHTVGPVWHGGNRGEENLLRNCYLNSLKLAVNKGIKSVSFPSVSTGIYGYPFELAAKTAIETVCEFAVKYSMSEVRFVLYSQKDYDSFLKLWDEYLVKRQGWTFYETDV